MEIPMRFIQLLLSMSLLILLHEMGHFLPAKWFRTRVEKFYLFFDPWFSLFKKKIGGTEYGIGWLPLGGYVKIAGMVDESMDTEKLKNAPQPWEFRAKPAWQRLIIMIGGITVNILLGCILFIMINFIWGKEFLDVNKVNSQDIYVSQKLKVFGFRDGDVVTKIDNQAVDSPLEVNRHFLLRDVDQVEVRREDGSVTKIAIPDSIGMYMWKQGIQDQAFALKVNSTDLGEVLPGYPAEKAGLRKGDKILTVNGIAMNSFNQISEAIGSTITPLVEISFERNGQTITKQVALGEDKKMGIAPRVDLSQMKNKIITQNLSIGESLVKGVQDTYYMIHDMLVQFKYVFTKKGASQLGGFGSIAKMFPTEWDWHQFWVSTAFISIMLGVMNFLPIPALDGGHILFLLWEMLTGRKPNDKFLEYAHMVGIIFLVGLTLYANGMDILRAFK